MASKAGQGIISWNVLKNRPLSEEELKPIVEVLYGEWLAPEVLDEGYTDEEIEAAR